MAKDLIQQLQETSHLSASNIAYVEQLYDTFLKNPEAIPQQWREYFEGFQSKEDGANGDVALSDIRQQFLNLGKRNEGAGITFNLKANVEVERSQWQRQEKIEQLINAYRCYGHLQAKIDPLELTEQKEVPVLQLSHYGFNHADLDHHFNVNSFISVEFPTLRAIHTALIRTYCDTFGIEYMHLSDVEQVKWLQQRIESVQSHPIFSPECKRRILQKLIESNGLEKYLGAKYVGQTRFSLEGSTTLIPMLDELVQRAGVHGVKEMIIGMGHRGRLNTLVNIVGKPIEGLLQEFEGKSIKAGYSGDVKYHSGYSSNIRTDGGIIHLALTFNPSHLEIIDPVVEGSVRARQDRRADIEHSEVVPVLIHGDAAFSGQGVVMETLCMSQARGFTTGGTVHIVVNNQIGFTTSDPKDARSSLYCTDVAKMVEAPIFHVNADDPEACVFAIQVALDFRMTFKKDVVIDFVCYRRFGHNEADEPAATQPLMYRKIKPHLLTMDLYAQQLVKEQIITASEVEEEIKRYRNTLDDLEEIIKTVPKSECSDIYADWSPYKHQSWTYQAITSIPKEELLALGNAITTLPDGFTLQAQVAKEYENRVRMLQGELPFNWGFAESLAYASLVKEGFPVRLCGQDSGRGTFAHRHAAVHDQKDGNIYIPLQHVAEQQAQFTVIDSILSEEAVLGFEYGYATTDPECLAIWEAQYGDFVNGAQVVIDQFITSGEQKWGRLCGLVLFLPHGYEGAGPEHSSARLERFLQSCAQKNIQICIPSTPAQIFHLLRRQMLRPYRKPLIVFTPKSLLRHRLAVSSIEDLTKGAFRLLIPEIDAINFEQVRRVIFCSGKVYYDLLSYRRENKQDDIAIIRLEQLYPFPKTAFMEELKHYAHVKQFVWCQEEPKNQGAWYSINYRIRACLQKGQHLAYVGRPSSASPATGYTSMHLQEQVNLVKYALS